MSFRDQYHDPAYGMLFHILEENPQVADFVKHAELDENKTETLPDGAFAWPARRLFPIDTAENTILSYLYREKCAAVPVEVDENLRKAADVYDIHKFLAHPKQQKTASVTSIDDADYLLTTIKRLRVKTAEDVQAAEKILLEQYPRLNLEDRTEGFINLVKKARDLGVTLQPETHRMAGMTVCTAKMAEDFIEARRCATKEPLFQRAYEKLASAFHRDDIHDRDTLITAVDALAQLDKKAGLTKHYDKLLPDPIRTIFNTTKLAEEDIDIAGRRISLNKLASLPSTFWQDLVGPEMVKEITTQGEIDRTKLAQILPTLPLDLKVVLKQQVH